MATFDEILSKGGITAVSGVDSVQGIETLIPKKLIPEVDGGSDSGSTFNPTTSATGTTMGFQDLGGMVLGGIISAINPVLGMAYSLANPNSIARQVLSNIGYNPTTEGSVPTNDFSKNVDGFSAADFGGGTGPGEGGGFDSAAEDSDQSGGDAGSTSGTDSAGDGGDGYATGGRVRYADGTIAPIDYQSYLNSIKNYYAPVGSVSPMDQIDFSNFYDKEKGFKQRIYLPYDQFVNALQNMGLYAKVGDDSVALGNWDYVAPDKSLIQPLRPAGYGGGLPYSREELEKMYLEYLKQPKEPGFNELSDTSTPTEDFSDYLNGLTPNWSPGDPAPEGYEVVSGNGDTWIEPIARTLFPQTNLQQIKETATSPTQYNIEATKDLVQNLPAVIQPFAPAVAGVMSLPYDAIQAYQRMQPGSGISGFAKAYAAERPLQSAYERFIGASGPLAENINKAVSNLNPFQQQQYMQYAANNPDQAREAAQRNQDFVQATQRTQQKSGGRIGYLQGGLSSLLGNYYG